MGSMDARQHLFPLAVQWARPRPTNNKVFEGIERHANSMMAEVKTEARLWTQARVYLD
jgi:hypothetical protein